MEEISMAKASLPWEWIVEKLVDFREVGTPLLKAMISHIPDINNSSCINLQERIALRYLEEILFVGKIEAHAIPVMKVFVDSSLSNSTAAEDLLLRICTEVVFGHIREADENGERDWEGFEDDLKRIFAEDSLSPSFVGRRNELLEILNDKSTYISTLEKYPVEVLKSDLFHFVRDKKACLYKTVLDQVVCDVSNREYYTGSSFVHKHEECVNSGGRKRFYRETILECEHSSSEVNKRLKHVGNDGSSSNVKKIKECMIIGHTDSKNSFQKEKYFDSRTENSHKDIRESTANDSPDMRCRQEVNCNRDKEILQLSNDTLLTSNGHGHCHEITDDDAQGLEGQVSEPEKNNLDAKSRKEDHRLLEAEDLPELDHILFGNGCPGQSCFKCRKGGALSYCDECSTAAHEKCLQPDSSITLGKNAGCPVCSYKRALAAYKKAKNEALESKKILLAFIDNKAVQHNGQKSQERCRSEKEIFPNTKKTSNDHSSNPSASNLHSNRKEMPLQTRDSETLHKNQMLNGTENDQPFMQHAYGGSHDGDCKRNNAEDRNYSLRQRKSPTAMRGNSRLPGARRVKLTWTKAEEEILKEGVQKFASINNNVMPWKLILEHGIGIFHKSRLSVDLKDKWRNMNKGSS